MNKKKQKKITWLIAEINSIIKRATQLEKDYKKQLHKVHPRFEETARNLVHYRALRMADISILQKKLGNMGLSRLSKSGSHIMASLVANKNILTGFLTNAKIESHPAELLFKKTHRQEEYNAKALHGYRSEKRRTRIMVTIPSEAANNYQLIHDMISQGMNGARINCAHDNPEIWKKMVGHIRTASKKLKKKCRIAMDLGGPKIRTGALAPGPKIRKFRPAKNVRGEITAPCRIWIGKNPPANSNLMYLPIDWKKQTKFELDQQLFLKDTRNKKRKFIVAEISKNGYILHAFKTTYVETGMKIYTHSKGKSKAIIVGEISPVEQAIILHVGDLLCLHKKKTAGENAVVHSKKGKQSIAHISCTLPEVLKDLKLGEPIFFDDGKIEGIFRKVNNKEVIIEVIHAKMKGGKLRADKGINLPASNLSISGLTKKDKKDLKFIVQYADVVNLSFVNNTQDVRDLLIELHQLKALKSLGIIFKIETQSGFNHLTEILLEAMQIHPLGIMIARGDLAIECGWENIGRIQEEILGLCQAAAVPAIWATQVLENLSKQGMPSRAEITDATMAQRADGVMLNKGPFILKSIKLLDSILTNIAPYQEKNIPFLPKLAKANGKQ